MKALISFLSGKKTYIVSLGAIVYALGISRSWWPHSADVDLLFGGTYGLTLRAAIAKLCQQIAGDVDEPKIAGPPRASVQLIGVIALLPVAFLFSSCADQAKQDAFEKKVAAIVTSPAAQKALTVAGNAAMTAALSAGDQYFQTGQVNGLAVGAAAWNGAATQLRSLQNTPQAAQPGAIIQAINSGGGVPGVTQNAAPKIAAGVANAIDKGVPPDIALETIARKLDTAAANLAPTP